MADRPDPHRRWWLVASDLEPVQMGRMQSIRPVELDWAREPFHIGSSQPSPLPLPTAHEGTMTGGWEGERAGDAT
jgi:hypothetical protein